MTIRTLMTACALGTLAACGFIARGQTTTPPPNGRTETNFPFYWVVTGSESQNVNFSGLPIQRGRAVIFYEQSIGRYPRVWIDPETGRQVPEHGSIPQRANWDAHLTKLRRDVAAAIPQADWDGCAVLDFEGWEPVWAKLNQPMKDLSVDWVRQRFPNLSAAQRQARAKEEFEAAGLDFMLRTLQACKAERPRAKWGFYGYPYPYPAEDTTRLLPLYQAVDAFYPPNYACFYSVPDGAATAPGQKGVSNYIRQMNSKMTMIRAVAPDRPVYSFIWVIYHDMNSHYKGQFVNDLDFQTMLREPFRLGVDGTIFWDHIADAERRDRYDSFFSGRGGMMLRNFIQSIQPQTPTNPPPIVANNGTRTMTQTVKQPPKTATPVRVLTSAPTGDK